VGELPDSPAQTRPGKRERLVASAGELLHRRGAEGPTLAEIAHAADVPPGNVYYYFKTRDDLVRAVIASRADEVRALLASLESRSTPRLRLKAMARSWTDMADLVVAFGCPIGSLASDLSRRDDGLGVDAAEPIALMIDWAAEQFRAMGRRDARDLATTLLAGVQGAAVLANALQDQKLLIRETRRIERWIDELDQAPTVRSSSANSAS
jgi:TetR/AcrR family transcriptional regulator, transcriptional repressor for nem operon